MKFALSLALACGVPLFSVVAAELRPLVMLAGPVVHLRDLFADAGPNADRALGPGPAPGARLSVAAPQLAAIARQFGVDWRPASPADRAVLEWPGRPLRRDDAIAALRPALIAAGAEEDCVIELTGFVPPLVPAGIDPRPEVGQIDFNPTNGRFTAELTLTAEGMAAIAARVGGVAEARLDLPVLAARLPAGAVVREADLRVGRFGLSVVKAEPLRDPARIVGMRLKRSVGGGQPLRAEDLARPPVVARDSAVRVVLDMGGLSVSGQAVALEAGAIGERIRLRNPLSRAVLEGEVVGVGVVRVAPDTLPSVARRGDG
jgi:flagella basal body P-ring formation protein FlgA